MPALTVFIVLLCGCPLLLVNFHRFPFEVQESFYFKNAVNCLEKLELVICMHSLRLCSRWQLNLLFMLWEIGRYILILFFLLPNVRGVIFGFLPPPPFFFLEKKQQMSSHKNASQTSNQTDSPSVLLQKIVGGTWSVLKPLKPFCDSRRDVESSEAVVLRRAHQSLVEMKKGANSYRAWINASLLVCVAFLPYEWLPFWDSTEPFRKNETSNLVYTLKKKQQKKSAKPNQSILRVSLCTVKKQRA